VTLSTYSLRGIAVLLLRAAFANRDAFRGWDVTLSVCSAG
jgi:hypothetical protein